MPITPRRLPAPWRRRAVFPGRRLVVVFQPHQASRTEALFDDFAHALAAAEECHIAPVFTAREQLDCGAATEVSARLARRVSERGDGDSCCLTLTLSPQL